ncbi:hypothetical protein BT63DRAFT_439964 [Microthyrium microscopicum]|uniref:gamma-glutamylcyclotransferase n=1 Tax=Microthyrium microscopicum TaxID=703497 RepID=A0A6A6UAG9_9PEZI|nr:hypothetical protein BT63DRAFT_439964 [Microthyrium microscopicum]
MSIPHLSLPEDLRGSASRSPSPAPRFAGTLYFGYGSNLWQHQVAIRCPNARFVGIGRLRHWSWQINEKGYANVVQLPKAPELDDDISRWLGPLIGDHHSQDLRPDSNQRTYGMVYELTDEDVNNMDRFDDVPNCYVKEEAEIELWQRKEGQTGKLDILRRGKRVRVMFYCDRTHVTPSPDTIFRAYSYKMNQGIIDALGEGIPEGYINKCVRPFVPAVETSAVEETIQGWMDSGLDIKKVVEKLEDRLAAISIKEETNTVVSKESLQSFLQSEVPSSAGAKGSDGQKSPPRRRALSSRW